MLPLFDPFRSSQNRDWLLAWFFAAQVHWTVAMSQMIQDDSQLIFGRDPTGNWRRWKNEKRSFLETKNKVWVYIE